jgi:hypothetical protein
MTGILECMIICALCIVGLTQVIKNFLDDGDITTGGTKKVKGWVWTLVVSVVSVFVVLIYELLPSIVVEVILSLSAASLFYDTVYKGFQAIIKGLIRRNGGNDGCAG